MNTKIIVASVVVQLSLGIAIGYSMATVKKVRPSATVAPEHGLPVSHAVKLNAAADPEKGRATPMPAPSYRVVCYDMPLAGTPGQSHVGGTPYGKVQVCERW